MIPRERGKPRRGSAWYTHAAQRQRRQKLEKALSLASSILRQRAKATSLSPWAYAEDILPKEGTHTPPEKFPLSELGNWKPTSTMREENTLNALETQARSNMMGGLCNEIPTCYVEEVPYTENTLNTLETQARSNMRGEAL
jgi:hypothetical protein